MKNNNIFAVFSYENINEKISINCKAFSTKKEEDDYFKELIETIEKEKIIGDIRYYNKGQQEDYYEIFNDWINCSTVKFIVHKLK